jgi:hypothetical protein
MRRQRLHGKGRVRPCTNKVDRWPRRQGCVAGFEVFFRYGALSALVYISRLWPFLSFSNFKLHLITFLKTFVALGCDRAVMNKNIGTIPTADEPVAFCVIEPLYCAFHLSPFFRPSLIAGGPDVTRNSELGCTFELLGWSTR